jgi:ribosome biogenesis GTPase
VVRPRAEPDPELTIELSPITRAQALGAVTTMTNFNPLDPSPLPPSPSPALAELGLSPRLRQEYDCTVADSDAALYRVARVDAQGCALLGPDPSAELRARIPKRLAQRRPPVVGDWAVARERRGELVIRQLLERATTLTRRAAGNHTHAQPLAANLDRVLICSALDRDFNLARLERWLSLVHEGGAVPVVVLTKAGLIDDEERARRRAEAEAVALGVEVLTLDVLAGLGVAALDRALEAPRSHAVTLACVGSSGVGKSTLVNYLSGVSIMQTSSISAAHGKGRHTTSHRELVHIPARRLLVIDTPGLREVGLWGEGDGVDATFADIVALARGCRFSDCAHDHEPSCAVKDAVARGELDPRRLESWRRLITERESTARRANEHERRRHERGFAKQVRETLEAKRRRRSGS